MIFAILRSDYLEFIRKKSVDATHQLSSAYTFCAAKLLHVFVWTTKKGREPVQITQKQIREQYLLSEHGKDAIAASTKLFEELGILIKSTNDRETNKRNGQNKTYRYSLNYPRLCELLGFEPQDIDEDSVPDDENDSSSGDCSPPYKDLFNTSSNTTTTNGVESEESEEEVKTAIANAPFMQEEPLEFGDKKNVERLNQKDMSLEETDPQKNVPHFFQALPPEKDPIKETEYSSQDESSALHLAPKNKIQWKLPYKKSGTLYQTDTPFVPTDPSKNVPLFLKASAPLSIKISDSNEIYSNTRLDFIFQASLASLPEESNNSQITIFHRLRNLGISGSKVQSLVKQTLPKQLERNIQALEEEAATKGLEKPLAAFFACVKDNWQPRNDKQSWWKRAAIGLGRERRDRLISCVTELMGRVMVCFVNGLQLPLDEVMGMEWDAIALAGGEI